MRNRAGRSIAGVCQHEATRPRTQLPDDKLLVRRSNGIVRHAVRNGTNRSTRWTADLHSRLNPLVADDSAFRTPLTPVKPQIPQGRGPKGPEGPNGPQAPTEPSGSGKSPHPPATCLQ